MAEQTIFPSYTSGAPPPAPPSAPQPKDPALLLTPADLATQMPVRFQRTLLGIAGTFSLMMSVLDRMPSALSNHTKIPQVVIDQVRCGAASGVTVEALCTLAEALGCELEVRLNPRQRPQQPPT